MDAQRLHADPNVLQPDSPAHASSLRPNAGSITRHRVGVVTPADPAAGRALEQEPDLRRVLNLWDATCVVVGAIIGVGIFFNPRDVAASSGSATAAMMAWTIGGVIAMLGAVTFAELGRMRPVAGGQYHVLRDAYGRAPAFLFVFCNLTAVQAGGVAIISIVCAQNLGVALHGVAPSESWTLGVATVLTWALVGVNLIGVRSGAGLQNTTVVLKLVTLAAVVALAASIAPTPAVESPAARPSIGF